FGSDLDKATQRRLTRGERLVELLKQPQYQPMPAVDQVISLYCGTKGYLDDVPVDAIAKFESEVLEYFRSQKSDIYTQIKEKQDIDAELDKQIAASIDEFKKTFKA
ncbi:MAG: F0F1 ATP synthase subunit alpha, partial [Desulfonatronovibrio sp.]